MMNGMETMSSAAALRERAANCRQMAKEYHPSVGRPLIDKARDLDRLAAELERNGIERRRSEGGARFQAVPKLFGKRPA
ncbi:MAG: hypothetical protein JWO81_1417 [Alphaproteobacteria bacterium]|nr:hypothetical protein [Alphaproteobacteria bacterium]